MMRRGVMVTRVTKNEKNIRERQLLPCKQEYLIRIKSNT